MKISFFLRDSRLQVRLAVDGNYLRLTTGIKVPKHVKFAKTKQKFTGSNTEVVMLNQEVDRLKNFLANTKGSVEQIKSKYDQFINPKFVDSEDKEEAYDIVSLCNAYYKGMVTGSILSKKGVRFKQATIKSYFYAIHMIKSYASTAGELNIVNYNLAALSDLNKKRQLAKEWDKWIDGFHKYLARVADYSTNSMATVTTILSVILKHYSDVLYIQIPQVKIVKPHEVPIVVLDPEFIKKFTSDPRYNNLKGVQRFTWEVCATIMITSMRISDIVSLKWENLVERPDGLFLSKWNQKTGAMSNMLLPKRLADIFRDNMAMHGDIYTPVKGDKDDIVYKHIPELFATYEDLKKDVSASVLNRDGVLDTITKPMFQWVKPHMLRKTAITAMLAKGIDQTHVKFASGHSANSAAFQKYVGFVERNFTNELSSYYSTF